MMHVNDEVAVRLGPEVGSSPSTMLHGAERYGGYSGNDALPLVLHSVQNVDKGELTKCDPDGWAMLVSHDWVIVAHESRHPQYTSQKLAQPKPA